MREILFRGKRTDNGRWVEGYLIADTEFAGKPYYHTYIVNHKSPSGCFGGDIFIEVLPETVSQYTGLTDKNGMKIFEGDIINFVDELYIVQRECDTPGGYWAENGHILKRIGWTDYISFTDAIDNYENECQIFIVGNIHDNPELLDGAGNG